MQHIRYPWQEFRVLKDKLFLGHFLPGVQTPLELVLYRGIFFCTLQPFMALSTMANDVEYEIE